MSAGEIQALSFSLINALGNPTTLNNYSIKLAHTSITATTTTFQNPTWVNVFGPLNYTPINNAQNDMILSTPFNWDGSSNILMEICYNSNNTGTSAYRNYYSTASFNACTFYRVNGISNPCNQNTGTGVSTRRPNTIFTIKPSSQASSNTVNVTVNSCFSTLDIKLHTEGYYDAAGFSRPVLFNQGVDLNPASTLVDTMLVEWHETFAPYNVVYSTTGIVQTNGHMLLDFPASLNGNPYYIAVKHRTALETWTANPVMMSSNVSYDFSTSASLAYGNNQREIASGIWGFYMGDMNQDGVIDGLDFVVWETDNLNFSAGYFVSDLNGDGVVDGLDFLYWESNNLAFIGLMKP
jgi:hypothetical protein